VISAMVHLRDTFTSVFVQGTNRNVICSQGKSCCADESAGRDAVVKTLRTVIMCIRH